MDAGKPLRSTLPRYLQTLYGIQIVLDDKGQCVFHAAAPTLLGSHTGMSLHVPCPVVLHAPRFNPSSRPHLSESYLLRWEATPMTRGTA